MNPLQYVLDENLRGPLWQAIQQYNLQANLSLDVVRVGDLPDLPLGIPDPDVLLWTERAGRLLVSLDKRTMPGHLAQHLQAGHHTPGILLVDPGSTTPQVVDYLVLAAYAGNPVDYQDGITFIP